MESFTYEPLMTPKFILNALHLKISPTSLPEIEFSKVVTDSRKITPKCLFVALQGEKYDGHEFIDAAIAAGARGIVCRHGTEVAKTKNVSLFKVEDTLAAYRKIAGAWRREFSIPMIMVAGSVGKTTTKELLAAILTGRWQNVLRTQKSQNGYIGIAMTLLDLRSQHKAAIIEVGIDEIGAMAQHISLIAPTASVLTAIGPEHLEKLLDLPTVAKEEGFALSQVAKAGGMIAINLDDPWIRPHINTIREGRNIAFTLGATAGTLGSTLGSNVELFTGRLNPEKTLMQVEGLGIKKTSIPLPLPGTHNASNLLAALAIAAGLGLTAEEILTGLKTFKGAEGRSEIQQLPGSTRVICDYYNSQPSSIRAGIELLSELATTGTPGKRWACLGDMLELGPNEETFHREVAPELIRTRVDHVLLFGTRMKALMDELKNQGYEGHCEHFDSKASLGQALTAGAKPGDTVLIKGSRGMKMEEVWKIFEPYANSHWK